MNERREVDSWARTLQFGDRVTLPARAAQRDFEHATGRTGRTGQNDGRRQNVTRNSIQLNSLVVLEFECSAGHRERAGPSLSYLVAKYARACADIVFKLAQDEAV